MIIEFLDFLNEIDTKKISTPYKFEIVPHDLYPNDVVYRYIFETMKNNTYVLDFEPFYEEITDSNIFLDSSKNKYNVDGVECAKIISIEFTLYGRTEDNYETLTNFDEKYDVIGRISYLVDNFMLSYPHYDIFIIGYVNSKKEKLYSNYNKLFKNFEMFRGKSEFFQKGLSTFFVKK